MRVHVRAVTPPDSTRLCPAQYLLRWVDAVEALGFVFLRHQILERSHALAFVTRHLTEAELDALPTSVQGAPAMRMRSEDRSWNRAAAVAAAPAEAVISGQGEALHAAPAGVGGTKEVY